jgi:hypothetical protein
VIGWYTPDYRAWAQCFADSLREHGAPFDLIEVEKDRRGWEATTRLKPAIVAGFLDRHPGKVLILSDVDAQATGDLAQLAALDCDVAIRMQAKRLRGRYMIVPRSGTMVLKPRPKTVALIEAWRLACENAPYGDTDESCLGAALSCIEGLRIVNLQYTGDLGGLIRHGSASKGKWKASHLTRLIARLNPQWLQPRRAWTGYR